MIKLPDVCHIEYIIVSKLPVHPLRCPSSVLRKWPLGSRASPMSFPLPLLFLSTDLLLVLTSELSGGAFF